MLIEASRGGHTNVANLLLKQSRHLSKKGVAPEIFKSPSNLHSNQVIPRVDPQSRKSIPTQKVDSTCSNQNVPGFDGNSNAHCQPSELYTVPQARDGELGVGVKRLKISDPLQHSKHLSGQSPVQQLSMNTVPLPNVPVNTLADYSVSPGSKNSLPPRNPGDSELDISTSVNLPPASQEQVSNVFPGHLIIPSSVTLHDVIKDHTAADAIIDEYFKQRKFLEAGSSPTTPDPSTQGSVSSTSNLPLLGLGSTTCEFSSGIIGSCSTPRGILTSELAGRSLDQPETQVLVDAAGLSSTNDETSPLTNVSLSRLIPHLETLAGSLQDPNSLESRYLAALATHSQLGVPAGTPLDPSFGFSADAIGQFSNGPLLSTAQTAEGNGRTCMSSVDSPSLLSSAEIASLMPSLANFDAASTDFVARHLEEVSGSDVLQPMLPADFNMMKQLSDHMQSMAASLGQSAEGVADIGGSLESTVERALKARSLRSASSSLLLESNFPLDIPPPDDLVPTDHVSIDWSDSHPDLCINCIAENFVRQTFSEFGLLATKFGTIISTKYKFIYLAKYSAIHYVTI